MLHFKQMTKMGFLSGLFALLLSLSLVHPCTGDDGRKTVEVFKDGETELSNKGNTLVRELKKPILFRVPALVGGMVNDKEFLAVVCSAYFNLSLDSLTTDGVIRASYGDHSQWTIAEVFTNNIERSKTHTPMGDVTAVMKENKIYVIMTDYKKQANEPKPTKFYNNLEPLMFVGTVMDSTSSTLNGAPIQWEKEKSLKEALSKHEQQNQETDFIGGVGNGIVTKKGAIVFPILRYLQNNKIASSILYSDDNGTTWAIGGITEVDTYYGSVVEWKNEKLLLIVSSSHGYRKVFETDDMGRSWKESLVLLHVWNNQPYLKYYLQQGSAINAPVDDKDMLLVAHPLSTNGGLRADTLQLWVSDGQRIKCVGTISEKEEEKNIGSSILSHVGNNLYFTHEINPLGVLKPSKNPPEQWEGVIGLTPLPELFESAKKTVRAWHELDKKYKNKSVPTDGLVGFLRNTETADNSVWTDKYNCVNAIVKNGKPVDGGFRFSGVAGSGAQWPVSIQGQNQVYAFAQKQFTLAATVIIHNAAETGKFPLIGVSLSPQEDNLLIGLGYTKENKWCALSTDKTEITSENEFEKEKEYHVALTFKGRALSVYVDGEDVLKGTIKTISETAVIQKFVIGNLETNINAEGDSCTVNNVMLFNRPLAQDEIVKLSTVSKNGNLDKPVPTEDSTAVLVSGRSKQSVESTILPVIPKSEQTEEPPTKQVSDKSGKLRESMTLPVIEKTLSTTKPKATSGTEDQKPGNGNAMDKTLDHALLKHHNATLQKATNRADSSAVSFGFLQLTCVVCSIILLVQF